MFIQFIIYVLIVLGFIWLAWKLLAKPIMSDLGIEVEDKVTEYTKNRDILREKYEMMELSAKAAEEGLDLEREIKYWEDRIADMEKRRKEI